MTSMRTSSSKNGISGVDPSERGHSLKIALMNPKASNSSIDNDSTPLASVPSPFDVLSTLAMDVRTVSIVPSLAQHRLQELANWH